MRLAIITVLCLVGLGVGAADYYVSATGDDAAAGTIGAPWRTIYRSTRNHPFYIAAGDTLFIRGGLYSGNTNCIDQSSGIGNSGTSNSPITIKAYPGETVIVHGATTPYANIMLYDKAWWRFENLTFSNSYSMVYGSSISNFVFTNCTFTGMPADARWASVSLFGSSKWNKIQNCTFKEWGILGNPTTECYGEDEGSLLAMGNETSDDETWYNLIENCLFYRGGHDLIQCNSAYNVFRGNEFHNENWLPTNALVRTINFCAETNMYGAYGNRMSKPGDAGDFQIDQRNVWERNVFHHSGVPPDDNGAFGMECGTRSSIYRFNTFSFMLAAGFYFNTSGTTSRSTSNTVYGNVITRCGLANQLGGVGMSSFGGGLLMSTFEGRRTNNYVVNNIVWNNYPFDVDPDIFTHQRIRTNWIGGVGLADPAFVSTNGSYASPVHAADYHLSSGSPCIDKGAFLTTVTSANGTGTSFVVDNSLYFSDGNRIVDADTIQLEGQTGTAAIASIDHSTHTITVASPLTWTTGQGVSLPYSGSAPDFGAYEYASGVPPPPPSGYSATAATATVGTLIVR